MHFKNLFDWSYWFNQPFTAQGWVKWAFVLVFLGLVLACIILKMVRLYSTEKWNKEIMRRVSNGVLAFGLVGLLWMFFRQERVAFLAWRFWLLLWLLWVVIWTIKLIMFAMKRVPQVREEENVRALRDKYLPNKK